jgi:hypothetical protein
VTATARVNNVLFVNFSGPASPPPEAGPESSPWRPRPEPAVEADSGKPVAAARPIPARWSPRPVRVARRRFARSQLAADLQEYVWLLGLLAAAVIGAVLFDHLQALAHTLTGGTTS